MKTKLTKKQKINFSRRFSFDDWSWICGQNEFFNALEVEQNLDLAEVIAYRLLEAR